MPDPTPDYIVALVQRHAPAYAAFSKALCYQVARQFSLLNNIDNRVRQTPSSIIVRVFYESDELLVKEYMAERHSAVKFIVRRVAP